MIQSRIPNDQMPAERHRNWNFSVFMEVLMTGRTFPLATTNLGAPEACFAVPGQIGKAMSCLFDTDVPPAEAAGILIENHFHRPQTIG